ncbi:hypothetical protein [Tsukamurella soli]|uniref:Uncharacterized protein n=1 Tax=Tsukamurella soli TaxID=644556 RepID=A0ABP8J807_9ACTN
MARTRRGPAVLLWVLVSLACGAGSAALAVAGIVQTSALLAAGGPDGAAGLVSSPLGVRTAAVLAVCIASLVVCAALAVLGLPGLFGVRWAAALFWAAAFVEFALSAGLVLLGLRRSYTDATSVYAIDHNGQPMAGLLAVAAAALMVGYVLVLALTRRLYAWTLTR